jgi:uncharacterized Zn finger protein (UPF0148 family)
MMEAPTPATAQTRCQALTTSGQPCQARPVFGRTFCAMHDPERVEAMQEARRKGAAARNRPERSAPAEPIDLSTPEACRRAIEQTIDRLRRGDEPLGVARLIVYAASVVRPIVEIEALEARLATLEAAQQEGRR